MKLLSLSLSLEPGVGKLCTSDMNECIFVKGIPGTESMNMPYVHLPLTILRVVIYVPTSESIVTSEPGRSNSTTPPLEGHHR